MMVTVLVVGIPRARIPTFPPVIICVGHCAGWQGLAAISAAAAI